MNTFFGKTRPGAAHMVGKTKVELPILYLRDDHFALMYTADPKRVREILPSKNLHPVLMPNGRALMAVAAFNFLETSIGPYGEVGVVAFTVYGKKPLPLVPALMESRYNGFGSVVLHLPVTKIIARDSGRGIWGYPKFCTDMEFTVSPEFKQVELSDKGKHILTMRVPNQGALKRETRDMVTYTVKGNELIKTNIGQKGTSRQCMKPSDAELVLGEHPMADTVRFLGISGKPMMSRCFLERGAILPAGIAVEKNVTKTAEYAGSDYEGTHRVVYR
ncbi:MAG TPA: hypothetical protein ENN21_08395 [Spirochaetes bacterium]|nr:hypothetical protein [Spirochaetota bacterium]